MKKKLYVSLTVLAAILLLGSSPARNLLGNAECDVMRVAGFLLIGVTTVLRFYHKESSV